jgi:hypothetical protein
MKILQDVKEKHAREYEIWENHPQIAKQVYRQRGFKARR